MKLKLATHSGVFHADDVLAVAMVSFLFELEVVRTRSSVEIESSDIVIDVGGEYDSGNNRFDHHQKGGAGFRDNGVPYASAGLVWLKYGEEICKAVLGSEYFFDYQKISQLVDKNLVTGVDARDSGMKTHYGINNAEVYSFSDIITAFNPVWYGSQNFGTFFNAVELAKVILANEIRRQAGSVLADTEVQKSIELSKGSRILLLEKYMPWSNGVTSFAPDVLYVVFPDPSGDWRVQAAPVGTGSRSFELKAPLPLEWRGKNQAELADLTNCLDVIFCHNGGFIMGCKTQEAALRCAELALQIHLKAQSMR